MDVIHRLEAIEAIKLLKARYFRGVDTGDAPWYAASSRRIAYWTIPIVS